MAARFVVTGWVGSGTRTDWYRPDVDLTGSTSFGVVKLRGEYPANPNAACLVVIDYPGPSPLPNRDPASTVDRLRDLGEIGDRVQLSAAQTTFLATRFGIVLPARVTVGELIILAIDRLL